MDNKFELRLFHPFASLEMKLNVFFFLFPGLKFSIYGRDSLAGTGVLWEPSCLIIFSISSGRSIHEASFGSGGKNGFGELRLTQNQTLTQH